MINPDRLHRTKAIITHIEKFGESSYFKFKLDNGHLLESSYFLNRKIKQYAIGQVVSVHVKFSIIGDHYHVVKLGKIYL